MSEKAANVKKTFEGFKKVWRTIAQNHFKDYKKVIEAKHKEMSGGSTSLQRSFIILQLHHGFITLTKVQTVSNTLYLTLTDTMSLFLLNDSQSVYVQYPLWICGYCFS